MWTAATSRPTCSRSAAGSPTPSGLEPALYRQALHELDLPRRYRRSSHADVFGLGSTRAQDAEALRRFHDHLEPGGLVALDVEVTGDYLRSSHNPRESGRGVSATALGRRGVLAAGRIVEVDRAERRLTRAISGVAVAQRRAGRGGGALPDRVALPAGRARDPPRSGRVRRGRGAQRRLRLGSRHAGLPRAPTRLTVRRLDAHRVWLGYRGVEAFAFALGWTVAPIFFIRELDFSAARARARGHGARGGVLRLRDPDRCRRRHVRAPPLDDPRRARARARASSRPASRAGSASCSRAAAFMGFTWTFKSGAEDAWITDEVGPERAGRSFQLGAQAARIGGARSGSAPPSGSPSSTCGFRSSRAASCSWRSRARSRSSCRRPASVRRDARTLSALASMAGTARQGGGLIRRSRSCS